MQRSLIKTIFLKELRDVLRDRRTLFVMIVLPIILYPVLIIGFAQVAAMQVTKIAGKKSRVVIIGHEYGGRLTTMLDTLTNVLIEPPEDWQARVKSGQLEAVLLIPEGFWDSLKTSRIPPVSLYYNSSKDVSLKTKRQFEDVLETFRDGVVEERLASLSADTSLLRPFQLKAENLATPQQQQGDALGKILGFMLIMMAVVGAFYPAVDLTAGEKERGTLETLLVSPASRADIVYGKFFAVMVIAIMTTLLNILSLGGTMFYVVVAFGSMTEAMPAIAISPLSLLLVLLLLIPLTVIFAAVCLAIAVSARNYKEGQNLLTPVYLTMMVPAMISALPGVEITPLLALVPVANVSLLLREYLMGNYPLLTTLLTVGSSALLAAGSLWWATNQFKKESVLFRHAEELKWSLFRRGSRAKTRPSGGAPSLNQTLMLVVAVLLVLFVLGSRAPEMGLVKSLLISQGMILIPVLLLVRRGGYDIRRTFALRMPRAAAWPATLLLMIGAWLVGIELASLQNWILPFPEEFLKRFEEFFKGLNALPIAAGLGLVALLPGVCEELLCRGFVLHSLMPRFGRIVAVVLTALIFGLLHLDPFRFVSTAFLGFLFGMIVVWTGSIYPAMLAHACNNAFSYLVQRYQESLNTIPWLNLETADALPPWVVISAVVLAAAGLLWLKNIGARPAERAGADFSSR